MLMDLFFKTVSVDKKQRVHFNKFMRNVHDSKALIMTLCWEFCLFQLTDLSVFE